MAKDSEIPEIILKKIDELLDEDCLNKAGTAEKAAKFLLEKALRYGREKQFKAAMKFWTSNTRVPDEVVRQWFEGVFVGALLKPRRVTAEPAAKKASEKTAKKTTKKVSKKKS